MLHSPTVSTCVQGFGAVLYNFDKSRLIKIHQFAETSGKTCVFVLPMSLLMTWAKYPFQTTKRAIIRSVELNIYSALYVVLSLSWSCCGAIVHIRKLEIDSGGLS